MEQNAMMVIQTTHFQGAKVNNILEQSDKSTKRAEKKSVSVVWIYDINKINRLLDLNSYVNLIKERFIACQKAKFKQRLGN